MNSRPLIGERALATAGSQEQEQPRLSAKRRAVLFVGYYYLSMPVYEALKRQLVDYELFCVFAKDSIASDTNFRQFNRDELKRSDPRFIELPYDPPWFTGLMTWRLRTRWQKVKLWSRWLFAFNRFKREVLALVRALRPDVFITMSDMFFTPRYMARMMPDMPMLIVEPCYLDLWRRPRRNSLLKLVANFVQPMIFERQPYFGFEIPQAHMLVWEDHSLGIFMSRGRSARLVQNPTHRSIREGAAAMRSASIDALAERLGLPPRQRVVAVFPAYYADVAGHGKQYQQRLEQALREIVNGIVADCQIVIKVHPNENLEYWQCVFCDVMRTGITIVHAIDRFALMALADALVSTNSYAAVEATMSGTVTINFVPDADHIGREFCASFGRHSAFEAEDVATVLRIVNEPRTCRLAWDNEVRAAQERILGVPGTRPSVEDVLNDVLNKSPVNVRRVAVDGVVNRRASEQR